MSRFFTKCLLASLVWVGALPALAQPEVTVTLSATPRQVQVGDALRLEVRVRARGGSIENLELEDLQKYPELEILSHQTVRPVQFSFGFGSGVQVESSLGHVYMLRANAPGEYDFSPAVAKVDGETHESPPLRIVVRPRPGSTGDPGGTPSGPSPTVGDPDGLSGARLDPRAFLRTVVEPEEVYLGQQVDVTVYLYTRLRLGPQSVVPTKPAMDGFWVYDEPVTTLQAQTAAVMGQRYQVYALHRSAAFAQRTGDLTIGPPKVTFDAAGRSFFDTPERIEREGVPVTVRVKPLPQGPPNAVVGRYSIRAKLDRATVTTGDAVTFQVEVSGVGNVQDLRLTLPPIPGVRTLQPAVQNNQQMVGYKLSGSRSWEWILIAERPGRHTIPPIEVHYFDPDAQQYASATTPRLTFTATGAPKTRGTVLEPIEPRPKPERSFGPISMYSALQRGETPVRSRWWYGWLLGFPPLSFALILAAAGIARRREHRSTTASAVQRKLIRSAEQALRKDDPRTFYDRIVAAVIHSLDSRLGESVRGVPHAELRKRLGAEGFDDDLIERIINELEGADFARFAASGVDKKEMDRCLQRSVAIIERIERAKVTT